MSGFLRDTCRDYVGIRDTPGAGPGAGASTAKSCDACDAGGDLLLLFSTCR
ncbi:MAG: hypothetical protein WC586_03320 [Methanoregula sp.]